MHLQIATAMTIFEFHFDQSQGEQQAPQVAQVSTSMSNPPLQSQSALSTSRISQAHTPMYQQSPVTAHTIPQNSPQSMPNQVAQPQQQIPPPPATLTTDNRPNASSTATATATATTAATKQEQLYRMKQQIYQQQMLKSSKKTCLVSLLP